MTVQMVKLGQLAETTSGGTPQRGISRFYDGDIPWIKSGELPDGLVTRTEEFITEAGLDNSSAKLLPKGTLLIAMYGATVGKLGVLDMQAATNQAVCAILPSPELDRDYLFYWLLMIRETLVKSSFGGAQPNISQTIVRDIDVPLRPIHRQRRIATGLKSQLAAIEEARQAAQKQINEIRLLKTRALTTVLGRITNALPISEVAKVQSGFAFKSHEFQKHGVRLLRNTNILPGRVYWNDTACLPPDGVNKYSAYALTEGDVLISLDRPIISSGIKVARVAPTDLPALLVQRVGRFQIDPSLINPDYLYAFVQTQTFIDAISGHDQSLGVPHISPRQIESIAIPLPTPREQERLAKTLSSITTSSHAAQIAAEAQLHDIELLSFRLLAQAFVEN